MAPDDHASEVYTAQPKVDREGIALCLSGGGYRAMLFHLGGLTRLNELGILSKISTISSVSGGSILAAGIATGLPDWPEPGTRIEAWESSVVEPMLAFTKRNIRNKPILKRYGLPWNWPRKQVAIETLAATYRRDLTDLTLQALPAHPIRVGVYQQIDPRRRHRRDTVQRTPRRYRIMDCHRRDPRVREPCDRGATNPHSERDH